MASLDSTYGALLIGLVVGSVLFGLTSLQTHLYFQRFPNDSKWLRYLVAGIWILDLLHVIFCTHTLYHYLISGFGDRAQLQIEVWSFAVQTDFNGLIGMAVELFFARRVFKLSGSWILTGTIIVLALIHFILGIYFTVQAFTLERFALFGDLTWVTCVGLGSAAAADVIIAVAMVLLLRRVRTGIQRTDDMIATLVKFAINTGAITSIIATLCVILFALMPTNFIWTSFFWILGKLYANSLLANLNGRSILGTRVDTESVIMPISKVSQNRLVGALRVNVTTETLTRKEIVNFPPYGTQQMSLSGLPSEAPPPPPEKSPRTSVMIIGRLGGGLTSDKEETLRRHFP